MSFDAITEDGDFPDLEIPDEEWDERQEEARREAEDRGRCVYDCGACWRCR